MRSFDLTPLLRSTVGFDHLDRLFRTFSDVENSRLAYPPYNIEKNGEDNYRITMAVAGFGEDELDVTVKENVLEITGRTYDRSDEDNVEYLYRGIATRSFERRFELADSVQVVGARLDNGLLHVDLERHIPEHKKPRQISIDSGDGRKTIEQKKVA